MSGSISIGSSGKDTPSTGRSRSAHFNNPFRVSPGTPGGHRARKPTSSTPVVPVTPGGSDDPNVIVSNLSELPENGVCADCGQTDTRWLSVTLGVFLCKECGTIHKDILGPQFSDVRSLDLGLNFWPAEVAKFLQSMGNQRANQLWEHHHTTSKLQKPQGHSDKPIKEAWIIAKYQLMDYWKQQKEYFNVKVIQLVANKGSKKVKPTWNRRWFVLKWDYLELYESKEKEETDPLDKLDLMFATAKEADPQHLVKDKKIDSSCCFQISTTDKIYVVQSSNLEELDEWLFAIKITTQRLRLQITNQTTEKSPPQQVLQQVTATNSPRVSPSGVTFTQAKVTAGTARAVSLGSAAAVGSLPTCGSSSHLANPPSIGTNSGNSSPLVQPLASTVSSSPMRDEDKKDKPMLIGSLSMRHLGILTEDGETIRDPKLSSAALLATLAKTNELKEQQRISFKARLEVVNSEFEVQNQRKLVVEKKLGEVEKVVQDLTVKQQNIKLRLVQLEPENQIIMKQIQPAEETTTTTSTAGGAGLLQKEDGSIQGGTVTKLVQMLTHETYLDPEYLNAFLLTYRSFTAPIDLLEKLRQRFNIQPPPFITADDMKRFQETMQRPIRLRVFNVLKHWIQHHYYDFEVDITLTYKLLDILDEAFEPAGMSVPANQLRVLLKTKIKEKKKHKKLMIDENRIPKPILPPNLDKFTFADLDCLEVARQICIVEQSLFRAILPRECINQAWNHKTYKETAAPNILAIIRRFNRVSAWVSTEIVSKEILSERSKTLERLIMVANHCRELHNFNATQSILAGLSASSIYRMKKTWAGVDPKVLERYESLKKVMSADSSFSVLRAALHNESPPNIPYLGMYLTDLTFIEDGNPDNLQDGMINFAKRRRVAAVIREIQQYQQTPYALQPVPEIISFVSGLDGMEEKVAYDLSLLVEPRDKTTS